MDALRAVQLVSDMAYLLLGIAACGAAMRSHERARVDVAILFGALATPVAIQEIHLLSCTGASGCVDVPAAAELTTALRQEELRGAIEAALQRLDEGIAADGG